MRRNRPVMVKSTLAIIAEDQDEFSFSGVISSNSLADYQESDSESDIRRSFCDDIAKKYDLPREKLGYRLYGYNVEFLRSLVVFGEHEYIIDLIRSENGSF